MYGAPIEGDMITTGTPLVTPPLIDMISNDPILGGVKVLVSSNTCCLCAFNCFNMVMINFPMLIRKKNASSSLYLLLVSYAKHVDTIFQLYILDILLLPLEALLFLSPVAIIAHC